MSEPPTPPRPLDRVLALAFTVCLLDLTTGAFPSFIDVFEPVPAPPLALRLLEVVVLLAGLRALRTTLSWVWSQLPPLPGPRWSHVLLSIYLGGVLFVVLLRTELYPFSNVGMFSAVPASVDATTPRRERSVVFVDGERVLPVPVIREAGAASRLGTGWDYKTGWTLHMFGTSDSHALEWASVVAREHGYERAVRAIVIYDPADGRTIDVEPFRGAGP